mgnify:CR=1 FL=1
MDERKSYSTDLTNEQWSHLRLLLPKSQGKGRRRSPQQQRELINAMLYLVHTGCQWRELPHDFPPWSTVHGYFRELRQAGIWPEINSFLRRGVRQQAGRDPEPSVVIMDSQSVKTTEKKAVAADTMVENW